MVRVSFVVLVDFFAEERDRVSDEQVGDVLRQEVVDSGLDQLFVRDFVYH